MKGTVKSKQEIERLFTQGRRSSCRCCSFIVAPSPHAEGRCAFIAGKKLGVAPLRSRCKRVMREAARELGAPWAGSDVVFIARKSVATAAHEDVVRQMKRALKAAGVLGEGVVQDGAGMQEKGAARRVRRKKRSAS